MLRRLVFAPVGVLLCLLVGGFALSASALAAAPEEPVTVSPAASVTATSATLEGVLNPNAVGEAGEYGFFYKASESECAEGSVAPEPAGVALGFEKEAVSGVVSGLQPGTQYTFCVFDRNGTGETAVGQPVSFTTLAVAPVVSETFATSVVSNGASLGASVVPGGAATTYHFEYGATAAYGHSTPESASIGADDAAHVASAHVQDLQLGTVYHFRVVASNSAAPGGVAGPDHTFTTQPAMMSAGLPDGRGYEMVTPVDKGDGYLPIGIGDEVFTGHEASPAGDAFAYMTEAGFPGSQAGLPIAYVASRGAGGWSSRDLIPPQASSTRLDTDPPFIAGYSADLSRAALLDGKGFGGRNGAEDSPSLVVGEPSDNKNLFLRDVSGGSYQLMDLTPAGVTPAATEFQGASADFSHVVFGSEAQLTPEALNEPSHPNLFQWAGGSVSLISLVPVPPATRCGGGGPPCLADPLGAALGGRNFNEPMVGGALNAVSPDGSKVFFSEGGQGQIYMREGGTTTVEVSASQKNNGSGPGGTDPNGPLFPTYWPASRDGSRAFFTSCEQLTNDSTAVSQNNYQACPVQSFRGYAAGEDLYGFDTASGVLSDLTVDHTPGDVKGADVVGVLGSSADGSYVYFAANGVLAAGATPGDCAQPQNGSLLGQSCNVYLFHDGATTFVARVDGSDFPDWSPAGVGGSLGVFTTRATPDGSHLAFDSVRSLTGYDNTVASGGSCGTSIYEKASFGAACPEVFLYDAGSGVLSCASCNPTGARPIGPSTLDGVLSGHQGGFQYLPRSLSDDGRRVFFDSGDALVPGDVNGKRDVYEYEGGRVYLISSGTSNGDSTFYDASATGNDVFFATVSQLVGQDTDGKLDVYDARVGGGFPAPPAPAPSCGGEGCRAAPVGGPVGGVLGSADVAGVGNLAPPPPVSGVAHRALTRAQRLTVALRVCRREPRRRRASCVARARRLYGPVKAGKSTKRSVRGGK